MSLNAKINIRTTKAVRDALEKLAKSDRRSLSSYTEGVLLAHLAEQSKASKPKK